MLREDYEMGNPGLSCSPLPLPRCRLLLGGRGVSRSKVFGFVALFLFSGIRTCEAQWTPPPLLQDVPVRDDCARTNGGIGLSLQPTILEPHGVIFLCPKRTLEIDRAHPGASFFFRVHEYGHLALHTRNEALADAWAAEQLGRSASGRRTLNAVLSYFNDLGKLFAPMYGSGYDRALTVAQSGKMPQERWPQSLTEYQQNLSQKRARNGTVRLHANSLIVDGLLWIDDQLVGFVSTAEDYRNPPVPNLSGSKHHLRLQDVWVSEIGPSNKLITKGIDTATWFQGENSADGLFIHLSYEAESLELSVSDRRVPQQY
jgi:hypothetical protein